MKTLSAAIALVLSSTWF